MPMPAAITNAIASRSGGRPATGAIGAGAMRRSLPGPGAGPRAILGGSDQGGPPGAGTMPGGEES
jgi:hypothetical protein